MLDIGKLEYVIPSALFVTYVVAHILFTKSKDKKRREGFKQFSSQFGFSFSEELPIWMEQQLQQLTIFSKEHSKTYYRVLSRQDREGEIFIFDCRMFKQGLHVKETKKKGYYYTAIVFRSLRKQLPSFSLRPETPLDVLASLVGYSDIYLPEAPEFSKCFRLTGQDENAVRSLFNPTVVKYFEDNLYWIIEAKGSLFLATSGTDYCEIEDMQPFYEEAKKVYEIFF